MDTTKHVDSRRGFIKKLGAAGLYASTLGLPTLSSAFEKNQSSYSRLNPVKVSRDRIIRQVVGLRPYRPAGFNLSVEQLENKTIVHNYGHGGGGISLSWGTASLAIDQIKQPEYTPVGVLGAGVVGLSSAILLLKRGTPVTIYTENLPPNTTSNVAAAFWAPVSVYDPGQVNEPFVNSFNQASQISQRMFQDLVGDRYGVWWIKTFFMQAPFDFPGGKNLYPDYKKHNTDSSPFGHISDPEQLHSLMIEPPIYMKALLDDFFQLGGKLVVKKMHQPSDILELNEHTIMNCTGLGSQKLFGDKTLTPVKGQLSILLPQPEIKYGYVNLTPGGLLYMFPRKDGIILGGTSEKGVASLNADTQETERIIKGHQYISQNLKG
ncbi:FAD-dependent oxidoreductase [Ekhidna sp. MALMAid0563]|uniref:FAD-dependent oxidoreductase n=1 Tax=Ekhidna sp. MALMAid0563 TaxID=3143937 RepID=UPI0032DE54C5